VECSPYVASHGQNTWLLVIVAGGVPGVVVGALLSSGICSAILALAGARARRVKYVPVDGAELYINGVPLDEAQFRAVFIAHRAELDDLSPPAERDVWQRARANAASQRLAIITGAHPNAFPSLGDPEDAWTWYRDNNPYASARLPRRRGFRLLPPGDVATD
jgi:hypothetical protein